MNSVVNQFSLDDFDCFSTDVLPYLPARRLSEKLAALLCSINPDLCGHAEIVQLKDGSFWLRWRLRGMTRASPRPTKSLTRQQAFALLVASYFVLGSDMDGRAHSEFAREKAALLDSLAL
jgi:hypothetical protein